MIKNINFLGVPTRDKLNLFVSIGIFLIVLGFLDIIINTYFEINLTSFLPGWLNYFTPLIFGFIGLHYIRIEFSGNKTFAARARQRWLCPPPQNRSQQDELGLPALLRRTSWLHSVSLGTRGTLGNVLKTIFKGDQYK